MTKPLAWVDCFILAGGRGTRLQPVLPDLPKCLSPVHGVPIIEILVNMLDAAGARRIVLGLGYRHEQVYDWLNRYRWRHVLRETGRAYSEIVSSTEAAGPLGTGGALQLAAPMLRSDPVLILNGDTLLFDFNFEWALGVHRTGVGNAGASQFFSRNVLNDQLEANGIILVTRDRLDDLPPAIGIFQQPDSRFLDIGTPEGLAAANKPR